MGITSPCPLSFMAVLGASGTKALIFGFLQGVAGAISGLRVRRSGKKTAPHKTVSSRTRLARRPRVGRKQIKTRRVRSRTKHGRRLRTEPGPIETVTDSSSVATVSQTAVYSCPACGLQAPKSLMIEHLLGSPSHKNGPAKPEPTADRAVENNPASVESDEDSRDSLRNLLQILLPPRAFGRRREQKTVNPISHLVQIPDSSDTSS